MIIIIINSRQKCARKAYENLLNEKQEETDTIQIEVIKGTVKKKQKQTKYNLER